MSVQDMFIYYISVALTPPAVITKLNVTLREPKLAKQTLANRPSHERSTQ